MSEIFYLLNYTSLYIAYAYQHAFLINVFYKLIHLLIMNKAMPCLSDFVCADLKVGGGVPLEYETILYKLT